MNIFKKIIFNIEYKKVNEELELLEGYFDNRSEAMACLGEEYVEDDTDREFDKRYVNLCERMNKLEGI